MNSSLESANNPQSETVSPSTSWVIHFRANVYRDAPFRRGAIAPLPRAIVARIAASIAEFQRGESSEARRYLAKSEMFARRTADPDFHAASILFVREENAHAALLLRFMRQCGIPQRKRAFSDGVFRRLRAFSDLGWSSRVLIVAELIAQEYYPCLHAATDHPWLRQICETIIGDEEAHIRFQVERIAQLERTLSPLKVRLRDFAQNLIVGGAVCVVYVGHHRVLNSRTGFATFVAAVMRRNKAAIAAMHGRAECEFSCWSLLVNGWRRRGSTTRPVAPG